VIITYDDDIGNPSAGGGGSTQDWYWIRQLPGRIA